ncbi:transglycosylase SLT domain-containing protein [Streptomyces marincola]|uniref:Lytic transglycosylase n=1 Tax=Streptomyces marincola TaxID=2878388 RepID=A0A1W7D2A6_9ACTN|nr:transglycosylase SLT domain-containing protein [Streptomyces marincola]ARQ71233.1 lytic transglycosylase [Streptomyces marincola]
MPAHRSTQKPRRRLRRTTTAALATAGAAALALTAVPAVAGTGDAGADGGAAGWTVKSASVPGQHGPATPRPDEEPRRPDLAPATASVVAAAVAGQQAVAAEAAVSAERAEQRARAERLAAEERAAEEAASRAAQRQEAPAAEPEPAPVPVEEPAAEPAAPVYTDDLDGWIREALDIMARHGIPGTYEGLHRNIMRESSGDPNAINLWDINAINGTPSIGLLQVIQPTFDAYHVEGTPYDLYDPVANLVAAANYAADRYGSIDNVNGPY